MAIQYLKGGAQLVVNGVEPGHERARLCMVAGTGVRSDIVEADMSHDVEIGVIEGFQWSSKFLILSRCEGGVVLEEWIDAVDRVMESSRSVEDRRGFCIDLSICEQY